MFFRFPKDQVSQKSWINACKRKDIINIKFAGVCSTHFSENGFKRDLKLELTGFSYKNRRILKNEAVSTVLEKQMEKMDKRKLVDNILCPRK